MIEVVQSGNGWVIRKPKRESYQKLFGDSFDYLDVSKLISHYRHFWSNALKYATVFDTFEEAQGIALSVKLTEP